MTGEIPPPFFGDTGTAHKTGEVEVVEYTLDDLWRVL
jgi:hypothetical protein